MSRPVLEANRVIAAQQHHPLTDVYRSLRTRVLQALRTLDKTTLGITSANAGEGKTLTAVNLAIAMAMDVNQTVLLVDANLRNPGVADCLGLAPRFGLSDYLGGKASIPDCLINPGIDRLSIFPSRGRIENSAEILTSPRMAQLVEELRHRYPDRLVLYDLPPVLKGADTIGLLPLIEATLLVVRDGTTRTRELSRALDLLNKHNLIGTVLNAAL
ncbi:MAG: hypothetical protein ABWY00_16590 [Dongiaceae bacterium]